jgi:glycine/D-amino acid oxidase-like deaminating enzyme/nitrite reductase/ring-hydroxylating ferredoxin subunit
MAQDFPLCYYIETVMIHRDGSNPSLWQKTSQEYLPVNRPGKDILFDVIIVGGGITGVSTALYLQESGLKCLVLEAKNLCFGTTGGTTAHINTLLDTPYNVITSNFGKENARLVANAADDAVAMIKKNIEKHSIDCSFETAAAYLFSQNEQQTKELEDIFTATKDAGLPISYTQQLPFDTQFEKAVKVTGQAKFHPVRYVHGLAKAFEHAGGVIVQNARVLSVGEGKPIEVKTTTSTFRGNLVIYATHTPLGINLLHLRLQPYRSYAMAVTLNDEKYFEDLVYDMYDPYHYYRSQEIDGKKYLIVGGFDHKTGATEDTETCFIELEDSIRKQFKIDSVFAKWSSQFFEPADGLPYIGYLPGSGKKVLVATGFGGNGMTYSHVAALVLTTIIKGSESGYASLFDPARIKPVAGFKNFVSQNVEVVKNFVSKIFSSEKIEGFSEIKPGEARIVTYENEKLAVYKDENGNVSAVNPACAHMKCTVAFNPSERSWDCPCHGARYSPNGEVLTGPASHDLEQWDV